MSGRIDGITNYEIAEIVESVTNFLGSHKKYITWMETANPMLGNATPTWMLYHGRGSKLLKFVRTSLSDNTGAKRGP